ncbi:MAG TPA: hypothetical protein VN737_06525, partial [Bryobacteraceae bacterium]|nr:hypothetical protein [Bryobacteraceae bacterium]
MNHFAACRMAQGTLVVTFLSIIFNGQAHGQNIVKGQTGAAHENAPVFIENLGQFDKRVRFQIKMGDKTAWLTESGIVFEVIRAASRDQDPSLPEPGRLRADSGIVKSPVQALERFVFAEDFANSGRCVAAEPKSELNSTYNYFPSGDPSSWHTNVHAYGEVTCRDVWPGIDLRLYASGSDLEQEFVVQPDGDPDRVQISYRGIENLNVSANGSLEINTRLGRLLETPPIIYQQITDNHVPVDGAFKITAENSYSFDLRNYRRGYSVVIDPTLLYSTFLGGSLNNELSGMSVDSTGDTFLAGSTTSQDFPMTIGTAPIGETSFVTKLNSTGNGLVYSTFLGGTDFSFPVPPASGGVAIDRNGRAYVTGNGYNIPSTPNAFSSCGSFNSNFLAVLSPAADQLVYSTCLPGSTPVGIALDTQGRAVLAGSGGCGIATTSNAFQSICPANPAAAVNAGFVMIVDPALSGTASLAYASYLGDPSQLLSTSIGGFAVDGFGKVYVTGQVSSDTYSAGQFPTTPGAFRTALEPCTPKPSSRYPFSWNRCQWPYVAKLDPAVAGESS